MNTVGSVTINIRVSLVTGTFEAGQSVFAGGIFVAVVLASDTFVDLWLAVITVLVVSLAAVADSVTALGVFTALDSVTFVLVLAVENTGSTVARDWSVVVVLADTLVALAFLDTSSVLTTWVGVTLFLITAHLSTTVVSVVTFALETVALVDTCCILGAVMSFIGALVLVAVLDTFAVFH